MRHRDIEVIRAGPGQQIQHELANPAAVMGGGTCSPMRPSDGHQSGEHIRRAQGQVACRSRASIVSPIEVPSDRRTGRSRHARWPVRPRRHQRLQPAWPRRVGWVRSTSGSSDHQADRPRRPRMPARRAPDRSLSGRWDKDRRAPPDQRRDGHRARPPGSPRPGRHRPARPAPGDKR